MQHPDNALRAQSALIPFDAFVAERRIRHEALDTQVSDLVCNLLHLSDSLGVNPIDVVRSGLSAYLCEAIDPDHTQTKVNIAFLINGLDEFTGLATMRAATVLDTLPKEDGRTRVDAPRHGVIAGEPPNDRHPT